MEVMDHCNFNFITTVNTSHSSITMILFTRLHFLNRIQIWNQFFRSNQESPSVGHPVWEIFWRQTTSETGVPIIQSPQRNYVALDVAPPTAYYSQHNFTSKTTKEEFSVKYRLHITWQYMIYLTDYICDIQYVGRTI